MQGPQASRLPRPLRHLFPALEVPHPEAVFHAIVFSRLQSLFKISVKLMLPEEK